MALGKTALGAPRGIATAMYADWRDGNVSRKVEYGKQ